MIKGEPESIDFHRHLPPYRSLLSPNARYDYKTHSLVPISETELDALSTLKFNRGKASSKIKMKYKSLLSDVSRKTSILSMRIGSNLSIPRSLPPATFTTLPAEVIDRVLLLLEFEDVKSCMLLNKKFYRLAKPHLYRWLKFRSTYRLAQFVTYLRLNPSVGNYVYGIDLSGLKSGLGDNSSDDVFAFFDFNGADKSMTEAKAGWRDWKFLKNPLYSLHSHSNSSLWKVSSNSAILNTARTVNSRRTLTSSTNTHGKFRKLSHSLKYFKPRKSSETDLRRRKVPPPTATLELKGTGARSQQHPTINRFLIEYATLRDIPVGFILHLVNLCPNLVSFNLANISLSSDYEIKPSVVYKYQTVDLMNNYGKRLLTDIQELSSTPEAASLRSELEKPCELDSTFSLFSGTSGAASGLLKFPKEIVSHSSVLPPGRKYNSLLPPLFQNTDTSYLRSGDGRVFLSDLNLKSINSGYLSGINEHEILLAISSRFSSDWGRRQSGQYINMSSMVWLDLIKTRKFIADLLGPDDRLLYDSKPLPEECPTPADCLFRRNLVIDLSNSGMYKSLQWARVIDFNTQEGVEIARKILRGHTFDILEEFIVRDRARRGRIAENYLT